MEPFISEIVLDFLRDAPGEIFTDQYGAARIALLRLGAIPELQTWREPFRELLFDILAL